MTYSLTCPRCGLDIAGENRDAVADRIIEHARAEHRHSLDRHVVIAHLEGMHPHDSEPE